MTGNSNEMADQENEEPGNYRPTRRSILKTTGLGVAAAGGAGVIGTARAGKVVEKCNHNDTIDVDPTFQAINNKWGCTNMDGCIFQNDDDTYGWWWDGTTTNCDQPTYQEVLCGTKPFGEVCCTGSDLFPVQRKNVLGGQWDVSIDRTADWDNGDWNFALEWWNLSEKPGCCEDMTNPDRIEEEIMLVIEWGEGYENHPPNDDNAITDDYGNVIDYHGSQGRRGGGASWTFYQFEMDCNCTPSTIDLESIMSYVNNNLNSDPGYWVSGLELGNEVWTSSNTVGDTTINSLSTTVNGTTETSP